MHPADLQPDQSAAALTRQRSYRWADPAASAAAARQQDGAAFLRAILAGEVAGAPIAQTLAFAPVLVEPGTVVFAFTPAEFHYNPIGTVHGGVISTLCDSACGCAVHSMLPAGSYYTSLDLSVKFLRPVSTGTGPMTCEGTVIHLGGRSALAQATAHRCRRQAVRARDQQLHDLPPGGQLKRPRPAGPDNPVRPGRKGATLRT